LIKFRGTRQQQAQPWHGRLGSQTFDHDEGLRYSVEGKLYDGTVEVTELGVSFCDPCILYLDYPGHTEFVVVKEDVGGAGASVAVGTAIEEPRIVFDA
jgi:hypothetical protein